MIYLLDRFSDKSTIDGAILYDTSCYLEYWKNGRSGGASEELSRALKEEEFGEESIQSIKRCLIEFAIETQQTELFALTIRILGIFKDPSLKPIFASKLYEHTRKLLKHKMACSHSCVP